MSDQAMPRISRFKGLSDLAMAYGCPACSQLTPKESIYGSKFLRICDKCMVCCGSDAREIIEHLAEDRLERRVQLMMAIGAARDFSKRLRTQEALAHNEDVCSLMRDMCNGLDLTLMPTSGVVQ
jgi:hypothetical protein